MQPNGVVVVEENGGRERKISGGWGGKGNDGDSCVLRKLKTDYFFPRFVLGRMQTDGRWKIGALDHRE